jgi:hypothetical protein
MAGVDFIKITPGRTRRVRVTAHTRVLGQHVNAGQVIEVSEEQAHLLIVAGKAEFIDTKGK